MVERPLRIALITPEYPGCGPSFGIGRYVSDLAQALIAIGQQVEVLATTDTGCYRPLRTLDRECSCPRSLALRPLAVAGWLERRLRLWNPDIVEVPNWGNLGSVIRGDRILAVRLSTSVIDAAMSSDILRPLRFALEQSVVRAADCVISDSAAMAERALALYSRAPDALIPHAWQGSRHAGDSERPPHVLFVGRLEPRKGIDVLLAAWPRVLACHPDAMLHVVGRGDTPPLPPSAIHHGHLSDPELTALRLRCRLQAVPSRFESFGLVVLEAWAHGVGVITSDGGALPEVVGEAGTVVPCGEPALLASAIGSALPAAWRKLAEAGGERLSTAFSPRAQALDTVRCYRRTLSEKDKSGQV